MVGRLVSAFEQAPRMSRGRGRGRVRFGGSRDPMLADMLDETREDLGLTYAQMEALAAEGGSALYPPMQLPQPEALTDRDAYLIQRQRVVAHKLGNLYQAWGQDKTMTDPTDPAAFVHVTMPEFQKPNETFVPEELRSNTISGIRASGASSGYAQVMKPRAFEQVFKSLEAQEQSGKANAAVNDDDDAEEQEEDLGDDNNDYTFDYYDSDVGSDDGDEEVFF